jgi:hypothetical protein
MNALVVKMDTCSLKTRLLMITKVNVPNCIFFRFSFNAVDDPHSMT